MVFGVPRGKAYVYYCSFTRFKIPPYPLYAIIPKANDHFGKFDHEKAIIITTNKYYHFYPKAIIQKSLLPRKSQKLFFTSYSPKTIFTS